MRTTEADDEITKKVIFFLKNYIEYAFLLYNIAYNEDDVARNNHKNDNSRSRPIYYKEWI